MSIYDLVSPFRIFIAGQELLGWTEASLTREKKEMTGTLSISIFFTYLPRTVSHKAAVAGAEITAYVGGHLAFTGTLDKRHGKGGKGGKGSINKTGAGKSRSIGSGHQTGGGGLSSHIGASDYTITLRARGKTKSLIDSSHDHKTGTILNAKTKPVVDKLIEGFQVQTEWMAPIYDMDKVRFRDGATVNHEIDRVCNENGYHRYETRDGNLRVTAGTGETVGEPLILGDNILEFSAEQSEEPENSQIKAKGQRTKKGQRGKAAVNREKTVKIADGGGHQRYAPLTLQHYGDGDDESLERRAKFEGDSKHSDSKSVRVDVFHVMSRTGLPWDIGNVHYVSIPTEGIAEPMECTGLTYVVSHDKKLETKLTLSPLPGASASNGSGPAGLPSLNLGAISSQIDALVQRGAEERASLGSDYASGQYPETWGALSYSVVQLASTASSAFENPVTTVLNQVAALPGVGPLLKLP